MQTHYQNEKKNKDKLQIMLEDVYATLLSCSYDSVVQIL